MPTYVKSCSFLQADPSVELWRAYQFNIALFKRNSPDNVVIRHRVEKGSDLNCLQVSHTHNPYVAVAIRRAVGCGGGAVPVHDDVIAFSPDIRHRRAYGRGKPFCERLDCAFQEVISAAISTRRGARPLIVQITSGASTSMKNVRPP